MKNLFCKLFPISGVDAPKVEKQNRVKSNEVELSWVRDKAYVDTTEVAKDVKDANVREWTRYEASDRSPVVTKQEEQQMYQQRLDIGRGRELKGLWAQGETARSISKDRKGQRGYGERTLDKYMAIFNQKQG